MSITNSKTVKKALKNGNKKASYIATVGRFGDYNFEAEREKHRHKRVLLYDVKDEEGRSVAQHVWVSSRGFEDINIGDTVSFSAAVSTYRSKHMKTVKHSFKNLSNIKKPLEPKMSWKDFCTKWSRK